MATHEYLNKTGLSQLWNKAKAAFADKTNTENELSKKFELPSGGEEGQFLMKTSGGTGWGVPSTSSEDSNEFLDTFFFGSLYADDTYTTTRTLVVASSNNITASGLTITLPKEGTYLLSITDTSSSSTAIAHFTAQIPGLEDFAFERVEVPKDSGSSGLGSSTYVYPYPNPFYVTFKTSSSDYKIVFSGSSRSTTHGPNAWLMDLRRIG